MSHKLFTDEELSAYLDGEMAYVDAENIQSELARNPQLRQRLEALSISRDEITQAFDELLALSPSINVPSPSSRPSVSLRWLPVCVSVLLFGVFMGWGINQYTKVSAPMAWHQAVAIYQMLYVKSTLSHIERSDDALSQELARVSKALGKSIELSAVNGLGQLDYKRAQILGYEGRPLVQLAFLSAMNKPIALCIIRASDQVSEAIQAHQIEGMSAASWQKEGFAYLLIGGNDDALITETANQLAIYL